MRLKLQVLRKLDETLPHEAEASADEVLRLLVVDFLQVGVEPDELKDLFPLAEVEPDLQLLELGRQRLERGLLDDFARQGEEVVDLLDLGLVRVENHDDVLEEGSQLAE